MRRALIALLLALSALPQAGRAASDGRPVARLRPGHSAFWSASAPRVEPPESDGGFDDCGSACTAFALDVAAGAARLRVALDTGYGGSLYLYAPDGSLAAVGSGMSTEVYVPAPAAGRWIVATPEQSRFRMRAKAERVVPTPRGTGPLLPNLRLLPPYEFTFSAGCNPYEIVEYGARRCLRFSLGPGNTGPGPLLLRIPVVDGLVLPGPVYQRIRHADGRVVERRAGEGVFHRTHAHYHHNGFGDLELLRVTDRRTGAMEPAGSGPKQGFCMVDMLLAQWRSFGNAPAGSVEQYCAGIGQDDDVLMGLSAGWTDIYTYGTDGNYVEFGDNPDGYYVVRSTTDAERVVRETDETDNTSYAYLRVEGTTIQVLERGHGSGPWDPRKQRADDLLPALADDRQSQAFERAWTLQSRPIARKLANIEEPP